MICVWRSAPHRGSCALTFKYPVAHLIHEFCSIAADAAHALGQVFFIRDGFQFPDLVHAVKINPATGLNDPWRQADFFSWHPESMHMCAREPAQSVAQIAAAVHHPCCDQQWIFVESTKPLTCAQDDLLSG